MRRLLRLWMEFDRRSRGVVAVEFSGELAVECREWAMFRFVQTRGGEWMAEVRSGEALRQQLLAERAARQ